MIVVLIVGTVRLLWLFHLPCEMQRMKKFSNINEEIN